MTTYIYILQDPLTEEVRYVGKSNNPHRRYLSHLWVRPKVKYHSYNWIQSLLKKGLKPIMTVIDEVEGDWEWLEQYWIEQFRQWGANLTNGTLGGGGSYGGGKWRNKPVSCFDVNGNHVKSFVSIKKASKYYNLSETQICSALKKKLITSKGFQWIYGTDKNSIPPITIYGGLTTRLNIAQYDKKDNFIRLFKSIKDVAIQLSIKNTANIYQCINGKRKSAYGYKWKYQ